MTDNQGKPFTFAGSGPLQHLHVAVGVAERGNGPAVDVHLNANKLAGLVVHEAHFRQPHEYRLSVIVGRFHRSAPAGSFYFDPMF